MPSTYFPAAAGSSRDHQVMMLRCASFFDDDAGSESTSCSPVVGSDCPTDIARLCIALRLPTPSDRPCTHAIAACGSACAHELARLLIAASRIGPWGTCWV